MLNLPTSMTENFFICLLRQLLSLHGDHHKSNHHNRHHIVLQISFLWKQLSTRSSHLRCQLIHYVPIWAQFTIVSEPLHKQHMHLVVPNLLQSTWEIMDTRPQPLGSLPLMLSKSQFGPQRLNAKETWSNMHTCWPPWRRRLTATCWYLEAAFSGWVEAAEWSMR